MIDGLALTSEDPRCGVLRVLSTEPTWSDRRIGQICAVSPKMAARLRSNDATTTNTTADKRVGRDGRARPVHPGAMRGPIAEAIECDPSASLRAIASQLGVSPETVRSVRKECSVYSNEPPMARSAVDDGPVQRFLPRHGEVAAAGRIDNAFHSTSEGMTFVEWLDSTSVGQSGCRVDDVPLSRVYEIADEARRRASFWPRFADSLEARTRRRR